MTNIHYHYLISYIPDPRTEKYNVTKQVFVGGDNFTNDEINLSLKSLQHLFNDFINILDKSSRTTIGEDMSVELIPTYLIDKARHWKYKDLTTCFNNKLFQNKTDLNIIKQMIII